MFVPSFIVKYSIYFYRFRSMRKPSIINLKKSPSKKPNNLQLTTASTVTMETTSRLSNRLSSSNSS